jgi:uncharacterized protein YodC (DUF2158 family)
MAKTELQIGDIVQLKSGGPKMTVHEPSATRVGPRSAGLVCCQWFAGSKLEEGFFPANALNKVIETESK